jgi:hypothetical protein
LICLKQYTDQVHVANRNIQTPHILSPVSVTNDAVYNEGIEPAAHCVCQPCVPEIMESRSGLKSNQVQRLPPRELERAFVGCSSLGRQKYPAGESDVLKGLLLPEQSLLDLSVPRETHKSIRDCYRELL